MSKVIRGNTVGTPERHHPDTRVTLSAPITFTKAFGYYTIPSGKTSAEYGEAGQTLRSFLEGAFCERIIPGLNDFPTITISAYGGSGEVGSHFTLPTATLRIADVGSYPYGSVDEKGTKYEASDTGITFAQGVITLTQDGYKNSDGTANSTTNTSTMYKGDTLTLTAKGSDNTYGNIPKSVKFIMEAAAYTAPTDRRALDNLGAEVYSIVDGEKVYKRLTNGTVAKIERTATFTGYRNCFWGYKSTEDALANPLAIESDDVRDLGEMSQELPEDSYTVPAGTKQVFFLAPAGTKNSLSITNTSALGAPVACSHVESGVMVEGANGYAKAVYDMWYVNLDSAFSGEAKLELSWT